MRLHVPNGTTLFCRVCQRDVPLSAVEVPDAGHVQLIGNCGHRFTAAQAALTLSTTEYLDDVWEQWVQPPGREDTEPLHTRGKLDA